jgi:hypothetical protein
MSCDLVVVIPLRMVGSILIITANEGLVFFEQHTVYSQDVIEENYRPVT